MKNYTYEVWFKSGDKVQCIYVTAGSLEHAEILARADRIRAGLDDTVTSVRQLD